MASGIPIKISSKVPNELCDKLKFLLQEKQAGDISDIINEEIVAVVGKFLEYKCASTKDFFF